MSISFTSARFLAMALDPALVFTSLGHKTDPWQANFLRSKHPRLLLNCCRQAGKSTVTAALAMHQAIFAPGSLILLLSRSQRQAGELFRKVTEIYLALERPVKSIAQSALRLELSNGSRIVALPGKEANIRAFSNVKLLVIDEAARVPDDLYRSVRPMLAVSEGRMVLLSTPFGRRGFFWDEWKDSQSSFEKIRITAQQCPRITPIFLNEELRTQGNSWYLQEYFCSFESLEGVVYPTFETCVYDDWTVSIEANPVGGIDFGWHNPFAAVWGYLDKHDVLWIVGERYERFCPLQVHTQRLPKNIKWYADPAGRTEIEEMRCGNFVVLKGDNALRAGIAAVTARIQTNRLKVSRHACPNLIAEASLYRYPRPDERTVPNENPIDDHNHALAALRYLISRLDHRFMAKYRRLPDTTADLPLANQEQATEVALGHFARTKGSKSLDREAAFLQREDIWSPLS